MGDEQREPVVEPYEAPRVEDVEAPAGVVETAAGSQPPVSLG